MTAILTAIATPLFTALYAIFKECFLSYLAKAPTASDPDSLPVDIRNDWNQRVREFESQQGSNIPPK